MGGPGSGRQSYSSRRTTEDYLSIDIRIWAREGMLREGNLCYWQWSKSGKPYSVIRVQTGRSHLTLSYRSEHQQIDQRQIIQLDKTDCHFGGRRAWFLCPSPHCGQRVALLYFSRLFGCRNCLDIVYKSQRETELHRSARRTNWNRKRLGWSRGILNPAGSRPKGMHRNSYYRLVGDYLNNVNLHTRRLRRSIKP